MAEIHRPCRRVSSWYATDGQGPRVLITATPARPGSTLTRWPSSAPIGDGLGDPELLAESEGIGPVRNHAYLMILRYVYVSTSPSPSRNK